MTLFTRTQRTSWRQFVRASRGFKFWLFMLFVFQSLSTFEWLRPRTDFVYHCLLSTLRLEVETNNSSNRRGGGGNHMSGSLGKGWCMFLHDVWTIWSTYLYLCDITCCIATFATLNRVAAVLKCEEYACLYGHWWWNTWHPHRVCCGRRNLYPLIDQNKWRSKL